MFFIFGWGRSAKKLGQGYTLTCPNCHNTRAWQVVKTGQKVSLFFVPVAKWNTKYVMVCPICSAALELQSKEQAQQILATALQQNGALRSQIMRQLSGGSPDA